jgi:hypothetical protein
VTSSIDILFWFYRDPCVTANHLEVLRARNPGAQVFGLYGGDPSKVQEFDSTLGGLDDVWVHPAMSADEAWLDGDRMLARWYLDRGTTLLWSQVFVHQWDLVARCGVEAFALREPDRAILLPGSRPLEEVAETWFWVQRWSDQRRRFDEFRTHPVVAAAEWWACVFIFATFSRRFLDAWAPLTLEVPGFIEYRLPTLARALGFHFQSSAEMPDWGDQGSPTLNGVGRGVDPELIYADLTSRVWHPVYELIDATRL